MTRAATYTWTGAAGDGDWYNGSNWSGGIVPLNTDTVVINSLAGPVLNGVSVTAATIITGSSSVGSLTLNNSSIASHAVNIGIGTGTAFITLNNSTWTISSNAHFGNTGYAIVDLYGSSTIAATNGNYSLGAGQQATGTGIYTLHDNSMLLCNNYIQLGGRGNGTIVMNDNSRVSAGSNFFIAGNLAEGARALVEVHDSAYISVTGSMSIGNTGTGTLVMTDSGSLAVGTNINLGNGATHKGVVTLSNNALVSVPGSLIIGLAGTGTFTFLNGGILRANSITLASTGAARGTLEIAGNGAHSITRADGVTLANIVGGVGTGGATVLFSHSNAALVFNNKLTGALAVEVDGAGLTTLAAENDYTGGNIVRSGTLAGTTAGIRGDILADGGVVALTTPAAHTLALTGAGEFAKLGAGALTLASNFTGAFNINAGSVALGGGATLDNTRAVTLAAGGTLSASLARAAGQTLTAAAGSLVTGNVSLDHATLSLTPAAPGAGAFAIGGNLTFANSTLHLGLFGAGDNIITVAGSIGISGVNFIDLTPGMSGTYTLAGFGALAGSDITIDGFAQGAPGSRQTATSVAAGADLQILFEADISRRLAWTGADSAAWDTTGDNWTGSNNTQNYIGFDAVAFDGVADAANPASRAITLTQTMRVSAITVSGDADYTFAGAGGITSGTLIITETGNPGNLAGITGKLFKSGAGTLTFENIGGNNFTGGIEISGGAIVFNNAAQLGTITASGGHAAIAFTGAGGVLSGIGTLAAEVSIATTATATFDIDAGTLALAAGVSGDGTLEKTGAGTLDIAGSAVHSGNIIVSGGTLAAGAENLGGAAITNNAALALRTGSAAVYSGAITGNGVFFKTGTGALEIAGAITLDIVTVSQGALVIKPATTLAAATAFHIAPGAALLGTGAFSAPQLTNAGAIKVGRAADPSAPHGVMAFTGDYTGSGAGEIRLDMSLNASGVMEFDRLIIDGDAGGVTLVSLQENPSDKPLHSDTSLLPSLGDMLTVTGSAAEGAFVTDAIVEFAGGQYHWDPALNDGAGGWRTLVVEPASAIGALDAAALIIGKASFASLENRLLAARKTNLAREKQLWIGGFQRSEKLGTVRYDRHDTSPHAKANTQGIQAGVDWIALPDSNTIFVFGLFADYAKSDMHLAERATTGSTTSTGGGMYASWIRGAWHVDALLRTGSENYDATAARVDPFSSSGQSWGGVVSAGYDISLGKNGKWQLEPAARLLYQTHNIKDITDSAGRHYIVESADAMETRLGLRLSREGAWKNGLKCAPYLRAGWLYDFGSEGRLVVADKTFRNNLGGGGVEIGAGLLLEVRRNIALQAGFAWFDTAATQGATATAGIAIAW